MVVILFYSSQVWSQLKDCNYSLSGEIHDTEHRPMAGATVLLKELNQGQATDEKGGYVFKDLCAGTYTLLVKYIGYKEVSLEVLITNKNTRQNIDILTENIHLEEISVEAKLAENYTQSASFLVKTELQSQSGKSLAETLKEISGLYTIQSGPTIFKPILQGLYNNRILILNNGLRHEGQNWGSDHAPEIDPFMAGKMVVIRGASAVRYGTDALAGVILVEPEALRKEKGMDGEFTLLGMSNGRGGAFSGLLNGKVGRTKGFSWRLQGTYKKFGDRETSRYVLSNTGMEELDYSGTLGYAGKNWDTEVYFSSFQTELGILRSAHLGNLSDLDAAIGNNRPWFEEDFTYRIGQPKQQVRHLLLKNKTHFNFEKAGDLSWVYGFQLNRRKEFDIRRGNRSDLPALDLELTTHTLDAVFEHLPWGKWEGSLGLSGIYQQNINVPGTGIVPLIPQYKSLGGGIYWIEKMKANKQEWEVGLRYDYRFIEVKRFSPQNELLVPAFAFQNISFQLGWAYRIHPHLTWKNNLATAWRPPNIAEMYSQGLHHSTGTIEEGFLLYEYASDLRSSEVPKEQSYKLVSSLLYDNAAQRNSSRLTLEWNLYYNYLRNYIFLEPSDARLTIRGAFMAWRYNLSNAGFLGTDASLRWHFLPQLTLLAKGSLVRARDLSRDAFLINVPADRFEAGLQYEPFKSGKLKNTRFVCTVLRQNRQFRAPEVFTIAEIEEVALSGGALALPANGFDYTFAPAGYTLVSLDAETSLRLKKQSLALGMKVENLGNAAYRDYLNRFRYFADDMGRNVTLRLRYTFGKI